MGTMNTSKMKLALSAGAIALSLALAGCGGGGSASAPADTPLTPYEMAEMAIAAANTAEEAQDAVDNAKDSVTGTEADDLQKLANDQKEMFAKADRIKDQKMDIMDAAAMVDTSDLSTQEAIDAAQGMIDALEGELTAAVDISDSDRAMYQGQIDTAQGELNVAQDVIDAGIQSENIRMAVADARAAVKLVTDTADDGTVQAADDAIAAVETAISDAANLSEDDSDIKLAEGALAPLKDHLADAKERRTVAMEDKAKEERIAAQKVLNDAAMQVAEAINAHTVAGNPPAEFLIDADNDPVTTTMDLSISRGSGEAKITPYQSAADKENKPFTAGTAQDAGTGWTGMTFTRSGTEAKKAFTEMAAVYTDIEALKDALWTAATFPADVSRNATSNVLTIADTAAVPAGRFGGGASIPAYVKGQTREVNIDADGLTGTLYGVLGEFTCDSPPCQVSQNAQGIAELSAELTFTPDADAFDALTTLAEDVTPDADYTHFGYWTKKVMQRDGTYVHDVETFSSGMGAANPTLAAYDRTSNVDSLIGSASYYGAAAGVYVKKEGADDSLVVTDGMFTADAMLKANFGGSKIAADDKGTVSGTISGFMDGSTDLGFADLMLEKTNMAVGGGISGDETNGGETNGGGETGDWSASFFGNAAATTSVTTDDHPMNVSGEFNGHFINGHVAGAFGAEKD